jgi:hypothetical protein
MWACDGGLPSAAQGNPDHGRNQGRADDHAGTCEQAGGMADIGYRRGQDAAAAVGTFDRQGERGVAAHLVVGRSAPKPPPVDDPVDGDEPGSFDRERHNSIFSVPHRASKRYCQVAHQLTDHSCPQAHLASATARMYLRADAISCDGRPTHVRDPVQTPSIRSSTLDTGTGGDAAGIDPGYALSGSDGCVRRGPELLPPFREHL